MHNLDLLKVYNPGTPKIRCGINEDGGYVFAELDGGYDCYISAGVSNEESFTRDFLAKYGIGKSDCYAFDGTIADYPYKYTRDIQFTRKNIGGHNDSRCTNLSHLVDRYRHIFLKMDVEGGEYPWLLNIDESALSHFKQIVIEFHGLTDDMWGAFMKTK